MMDKAVMICKNILECNRLMPALMALVAALSLGMALMAQYVFGLEPCILCVIQRYPYGIVIFLGIVGLTLALINKKSVGLVMILMGLTFLANSIIAFYHTGVERHWWASFLEGCAVPEMKGNTMEEVIANLQAKPAVRCDEIPWADPILGLSMANYNVIFCLGLSVIAFLSAQRLLTKGN